MRLNLILILAFLFNTQLFAQKVDSWTLSKNSDEIKVFTRLIPGTEFKEFKSETIINASIEEIVEILRNVEQFDTWMPDIEKCYLIKRDGHRQWYYIETELPYPMENRDMVYHSILTKEKPAIAKIQIKGLPQYLPEKKGISRLKSVEGYWLIQSINEKQTKVVYQVYANPGGTVPYWLVNRFSIEVPYKILFNLRKKLEN